MTAAESAESILEDFRRAVLAELDKDEGEAADLHFIADGFELHLIIK
ncbi:hypothetical protein IR083_10125 [Dysgonomonas sp. GY75]|nr:hypothetical protein [Dysgonomonas sp. GY75]MBF0649177.1 hypothetical protein [Dysgonomonas sp. GY75]